MSDELDVERLILALRRVDWRIVAEYPEAAVELDSGVVETGRRDYAGAIAAEYRALAPESDPEYDPEAIHRETVAEAEALGFKVGVQVVDEGVTVAARRVTCDRCHRPLQNVHWVGHLKFGRVCVGRFVEA